MSTGATSVIDTAVAEKVARAGIHLQWKNIHYDVKLKNGKEKRILTNLNGNAAPGELLGIMGASGGGKTSLLSILTQRIPKSSYSGEVLVNGSPFSSSHKRLMGYVSQDVPFFSHLTAKETLMFAARLKLPESVPMKEKKERVASLLALMDLTHAANTKVGDGIAPGGLSGGERRRLALAIELLNDPMLLFGDEITSGLDSASALRIVLILRKIARERNCTVVLSLHQPRADLLPLLDHLLILAQGQCVYHGPTFSGNADDAMLAYFRDAGYPLPSFSCPTDAVLDILNADHDDLVEDAMKGQEDAMTGMSDPSGLVASASADRELPAILEVVEAEQDHQSAAASAAATALDVAPKLVVIGADEDHKARDHAAMPSPPSSPPSLTSSASTFPLRSKTNNKGSLNLSKRIAGKSRQDTIDSLVSHFTKSSLAAKQLENPATFPPMPVTVGSSESKYPTNWFTQVQVLLERTFLYKLRNPDAVMSVFFGTVITAIIVGSVFFKLPVSFSGARDRMSAIAFLVLTMSFACFDQVVMFPMERKIMLRENAGGAYKISAFYVGRTLAEFPVQLAFSCLVGIITWAMFGLQQSTLGPYVLLIVLATLTGAALLTLVGSLSDSLAMGNALASVVLVFASLFNGFFISSDNLVPFWRWIQAISFPAFAVRGAISVELDDLTYSCSPDEIAAGCTGTGSSILAAVGAQNISWRLMCLYLLIEMIVFRILTFLALHFLWTGQSFKVRLKAFFS